jgi:DNA invertase Pin-like site-specific DNA recombinase
MPRCFAYLRVSTEEQFQSRLSIDEQRRQCLVFAEQHGLDIGKDGSRIGEEAASAYHQPFGDRPLGRHLLTQLQRGDHLIVAKVDRAFRDLVDAFKVVQLLQDRGVVVHMLDLPLTGQPIFDRLMLAILAWCAEFESHRKSERMIDVNRSARRTGRPMSQCAPLGFRWIGSRAKGTNRLVYFPEERAHCRLCYELFVEQGYSMGRIASRFIWRQIKPFDKRSPDARAQSKLPVSRDYHPRRIGAMIRLEAEFRFYEAQGHDAEAAAALWLKHWGEGTLPTPDELQASVDSQFETSALTKGGTACKTKSPT